MTVDILSAIGTKENCFYVLDIKGISTKTLMSISRQQSFQLTSKSSRYTMSKSFSSDLDIVAKTNSEKVDKMIVKHVEEIINLHKDDPNIKQDDLNMLLPQAWLYDIVLTMHSSSLPHYFKMRGEESTTHDDAKELCSLIASRTRDTEFKEVNVSNDLKDGVISYVKPVATAMAIRKCYATERNSDNGGSKDKSLIKRVAIKSKHASVLRHTIVLVSDIETIDFLRYSKFSDSSHSKVFANMQDIIENVPDNLIRKIMPEEYIFLLEDD
jgi:thymidylate synthase ThyX